MRPLFTAAAAALLLSACSSVPFSTYFKLARFDFLEMQPREVRVAFRGHESLVIPPGSAEINFSVVAEDDSVNFDDTYQVVVQRDGVLTPELVDDKDANEAITIFTLSEADAAALQSGLHQAKKLDEKGIEASKSIGMKISGLCSNGALPAGPITYDVLVQTQIRQGYFVLWNNVDVRKQFKSHIEYKDGDDFIADLGQCKNSATPAS